MKSKILIADDETYILEAAEMALKDEFDIYTATSVATARSVLSKTMIDVAVVDLNFEGQEEDGLVLIDYLNKKNPNIPIVVLSSDKLTRRVVSATRRDLVAFIPKDGDYRESLRIAIRQGLERRRQGLESSSQSIFMTNSDRMKSLLLKVDKIAANSSDCSILVTGETGTGKEVLTKYIAAKLCKNVVAANMSSITKDMAESELFGHLAGSFTGATKNKIGLIEQANGGVFFLDELGDCSLDIQVKLLRTLEQKEIRPVGSTQNKKVEVQFIGATNKNLQEMVANNQFRLDLLQRLNTFVLEIPPLRDRPEDIILYATCFIEELRKGKSFQIDSSAFDALIEHDWSGNVRELRNVIERIITLTSNRTIDRAAVVDALGEKKTKTGMNSNLKLNRKDSLRASAIIDALEKENNNRNRAADLLGIHRTTFFRWIKQFGIDSIMADPMLRQRIRAQK